MQDRADLDGQKHDTSSARLSRFDSGLGMEDDAGSFHEAGPHAVTGHVLEDDLHPTDQRPPARDDLDPHVARIDSGLELEETDRLRRPSSTDSILSYYAKHAGADVQAEAEPRRPDRVAGAPAGRDPDASPRRDSVPEPLRGSTPEPLRGSTPEPLRGSTPEPLRGSTSEPLRGGAPEPRNEGDRIVDFRAPRARPVIKILGRPDDGTRRDGSGSQPTRDGTGEAARKGLPPLARQPAAHPYESVAQPVALPTSAKARLVSKPPSRNDADTPRSLTTPKPVAAAPRGYAAMVAETRQQLQASGVPRWAAGALAHAKTRFEFGATRGKADAALSRLYDQADRMAQAIETRDRLGSTQRAGRAAPDAPPRFVRNTSLEGRAIDDIKAHNAEVARAVVGTAFRHVPADHPVREAIAKTAREGVGSRNTPTGRMELDPRSRGRAAVR